MLKFNSAEPTADWMLVHTTDPKATIQVACYNEHHRYWLRENWADHDDDLVFAVPIASSQRMSIIVEDRGQSEQVLAFNMSMVDLQTVADSINSLIDRIGDTATISIV
jgi:hypothetical protein